MNNIDYYFKDYTKADDTIEAFDSNILIDYQSGIFSYRYLTNDGQVTRPHFIPCVGVEFGTEHVCLWIEPDYFVRFANEYHDLIQEMIEEGLF